MTLDLYDIVGVIGAILFLIAFAGMQFEKLDPHKPPALLMNIVGAVLVLLSLSHDFNLAAFIMESVWGVVAAYGLAKYWLRRRKS